MMLVLWSWQVEHIAGYFHQDKFQQHQFITVKLIVRISLVHTYYQGQTHSLVVKEQESQIDGHRGKAFCMRG